MVKRHGNLEGTQSNGKQNHFIIHIISLRKSTVCFHFFKNVRRNNQWESVNSLKSNIAIIQTVFHNYQSKRKKNSKVLLRSFDVAERMLQENQNENSKLGWERNQKQKKSV